MSIRPLFIPKKNYDIGAEEVSLEFVWNSGFSKTQARKNIKNMHDSARKKGFKNILEVSSKSENDLGVELSAFNLSFVTKKYNKKITVESAFQGSKVFSNGGPYKDLIEKESSLAKRDSRIRESGYLIGFEFFGKTYPINPKTFFYDWIYINALNQNKELTCGLNEYDGFTDIAFNPNKSINCQARSIAIYVSLMNSNKLDFALESKENFFNILDKHYKCNNDVQGDLL